jgi:iron-sulfur cluster repair protein YtfE (RIC family)
MDAIEMLEEQHRDVEDLFDELAGAEAVDRQDLFDELADQLAVHALIEERYFYPAVKARRTEEILAESLEEHLNIKRLLGELLALEPGNQAFDAKLTVLKAEVERHVDEEEEDLFPKVRDLLEKKQLVAIAEEMVVMQEELLDAGEPRQRIRGQTAEAPSLGV